MERERPYCRSALTVVEGDLWPRDGILGPCDILESLRHQAIAEVLRTIPESDYQKLGARADSFSWFIPHEGTRGMVNRLHATVFPEESTDSGLTEPPYVDVVYLAPTIEQSAWDVAVAIVAHELAHLVLDHVSLSNHSSYDEPEEEVFAKLCDWGFEVEAKKHRAVCRWRDTKDVRLVERYSEEMRRVQEKYRALANEDDR